MLFALVLFGLSMPKETVRSDVTLSPGDRVPIPYSYGRWVTYKGSSDGGGKVLAFEEDKGPHDKPEMYIPFRKGKSLPIKLEDGELFFMKEYSQGDLTLTFVREEYAEN